MYKCAKCNKSFTHSTNLVRHVKYHDDSNFPCNSCSKVFTRKDNLIRHNKEIHHSNISLRQQPTSITKYEIEDILKPSENVYYDYEVSSSARSNMKRTHHVENLNTAVNAKKARMLLAQTQGFVEIGSSHLKKIKWYYKKNMSNLTNYNDFLQSSKEDLIKLLKSLSTKQPIKYNLKLEATYNIPNVDNSAENRAFKTSAKELFTDSDIEVKINIDFANLMSEEDVYTSKGSGFSLQSIDGLLLGVYYYTPMSGSSYIPLPNDIKNKKAVINIQNTDQQCFKWALLTKYVDDVRILNQFTSEEQRYNFTGLTFPTPLHEVKIFERHNPDVSINVYGLKHQNNKKHIIYPLKVVDEEKSDHFDLLLLKNEKKSHYTYISNFSRLICSQKTLHGHKIFICKSCFTTFDEQKTKFKKNGQAAFDEHRLICGSHKSILPVMPADGTLLEFEAWEKTQRHPIVIYADFEALLLKISEQKGEKTSAFQSHKPMSYGILVKACEDIPLQLLNKFNIPTSIVMHRGSETQQEVAKHFIKSIVEVAGNIEKLLKTNIPVNITTEERRSHIMENTCNLCKNGFSKKNPKVADHNHLTGKFRQTLCNSCNLKLQTPNFVPCFFHNLSNYDAHFIVTELGYDTKTISVIPNSEEKFISFSKYISPKFAIRFIDTYRFMSSKLSTLASNLISSDLSKFRETAKHFASKDMTLVTRKGVYPYDYTDSWEKLEERTIPPNKEFYSTLTETEVNDKDYDHAKNVWNHFNCKNLGEYSDLYLKIDVLLLADVFENFRDMCIVTYNLDPVFYYTAPGFSFDCMLKYTNIKLELLSDYDMHLFFENSIRGGLTQASMRYAKANNEKTSDYDPTKPTSWLVYQDCNNLYGWAMSQYMPYGGFKWVEPTLDGLETLTDTSDIGRVYEVDVSYPQHLHDEHNDLPFLPENKIPPGSKVKKLMATLEAKKNYIVHYRNLQQAISNGLIIEKVHRVLEFQQSAWLAKYINLNTEKRKKAANDFEKDFFKLLNNAVFGKTMENMRKRVKIELVSSSKRLQKLINKPTFKYATEYHENLSAVSLENKVINFCKPIYIGFSVLDISKSLMYDYHYNTMKRHFGDNLTLMYTDTDSLVYNIITNNFYDDLLNKPGLLECMDTSNLPIEHSCYTAERKKIPGLFSDETDGQIMKEFIALRAKSYAYILDNKEKIKAKGIREHVVKKHMTFNDHMNCLFADDEKDNFNPYRENFSIRSYNHALHTIKSNKLSFNRQDDKRIIQSDRIHTYAHGHYKKPDLQIINLFIK